MATVYISSSRSADKFYTGSCKDLAERLAAHASKTYADCYTAKSGDDWEIYWSIGDWEYDQARKIEFHIKAMKSRKYIVSLKQYPEIAERLILKYK